MWALKERQEVDVDSKGNELQPLLFESFADFCLSCRFRLHTSSQRASGMSCCCCCALFHGRLGVVDVVCIHVETISQTDTHTRDLCPFLWLDSLCFKRLSGHHNRDVLSIAGFDVKEDLLYYDKCRCDSGQAPPALVSLLLLHQSSLLF